MITPSLQDEVAFISSVNADGTLAQDSYYGWDNNTPATYTSGWTSARKWGGTAAGTSGGTVTYYFGPASNWTTTEKNWFAAGLALWSAVANIKFTPTTNAATADITFNRTNDNGSYTYAIFSPSANACVTGGTVLGTMTYASVNIDTTGTSFGPINTLATNGGFTIENLLHEEGHALGLGHAGPYNGGINPATQQYSAYDTRQWSVMSYLAPGTTTAKYYSQYPVTGTNFAGNAPTTIMPLDILAIQQLYGVAVTTPLSGGQVFGFNCNITGAIKPFFDFTQNTKPIITIWDKGTNNTLNLSGFTGTANVNLNPGTFSSTSGLKNNIAIAFGTQVDKLVCTSGGTTVMCNNDGDTVIGGNGADIIAGGTGNDTLQGGAGNDIFTGGAGINIINGGGGTNTAVYAGNYADYSILHNADGSITLTGDGSNDSIALVQVLKFADQTVAAATAGSSLQLTSANVLAAPDQTGASAFFAGPATGDQLATPDTATAGTDLLSNLAASDPAPGATANQQLASDQFFALPDPSITTDSASDPSLLAPDNSSTIGDTPQIGWDPSSPLLPNDTPTAGALIGANDDVLAQSASTGVSYASPLTSPAWWSNPTNTQNAWHAAT